jgi:hypothetical protein
MEIQIQKKKMRGDSVLLKKFLPKGSDLRVINSLLKESYIQPKNVVQKIHVGEEAEVSE